MKYIAKNKHRGGGYTNTGGGMGGGYNRRF